MSSNITNNKIKFNFKYFRYKNCKNFGYMIVIKLIKVKLSKMQLLILCPGGPCDPSHFNFILSELNHLKERIKELLTMLNLGASWFLIVSLLDDLSCPRAKLCPPIYNQVDLRLTWNSLIKKKVPPKSICFEWAYAGWQAYVYFCHTYSNIKISFFF